MILDKLFSIRDSQNQLEHFAILNRNMNKTNCARKTPPLRIATLVPLHRQPSGSVYIDRDMAIGQAATLLLDVFGDEWLELVSAAMTEIARRREVEELYDSN